MTVAEMKLREQTRAQQLLQRQDNQGTASRKRSAVLVMGERQSTQQGRTKKLLQQNLGSNRDASEIAHAQDGGHVDGGNLGGVGLGGLGGGWESSGHMSAM